MRKILSICISALLISNIAYAAAPGAYAGLGLGYSKLNTGDPQEFSHKTGGLGGRIFAGYNFNKNFGLESGFAQYANSTYEIEQLGTKSKITVGMRALDVVGKAYLPVSDDGFNVYALGGVAIAQNTFESKDSYNGVNYHFTDNKTKVRPKFGVGASYDIPQTSLTTNLEFSRIQKDNSNTPNADMVTFNIAYNFGN